MIVFDLKCADCSHRFEGWFKDSAFFEAQKASGELACPLCASLNVDKALMAPNLAPAKEAAATSPQKVAKGGGPEDKAAVMYQMLRAMQKQVQDECDYVGDKFADEARAIHNGEAEDRGIYGEASKQDVEELADDGIDVMPIPWLPSNDA